MVQCIEKNQHYYTVLHAYQFFIGEQFQEEKQLTAISEVLVEVFNLLAGLAIYSEMKKRVLNVTGGEPEISFHPSL